MFSLRSVAGSSSSFTFPNCSTPSESSLVYAHYLTSHFSASYSKFFKAEREATFPSSAKLRGGRSLVTPFAFPYPPLNFCGCHQPLLVHCHWPRKSRLSRTKAPSLLWYKFSLKHLQFFLIFTFLSFHLEDIFYHSRVIRLRRVLTDHPPSGSSIDPASVAV